MRQLYIEEVIEEASGGSYPVGGMVGQSIQTTSYGPNLKYSAGLTQAPPTQTYRKGELPTVSPGSTGGRQQRMGNITTIIAGDEEVEEKKISNTAVIDKIEELITTAEEEDNPACTYALAQLMKHVKNLPG
tara:strand:+ start:1190 stop:1582 length:393 start_codon:yes stop_codon:yes gene_type:complete